MYVNGLMLISSVLDIGTVDFTEGNDQAYALYLPTYTAAAHFHGRIGGELTDRIAEAEEFATTRLPWALARGHRLSPDERAEVVGSVRRADRAGPRLHRPGRPAGDPVRVRRRTAPGPGPGGGPARSALHRLARARQRLDQLRLIRRSRRSWDPTQPRSTTTSAPSSATAAIWSTTCSPRRCSPGPTPSSRAPRSRSPRRCRRRCATIRSCGCTSACGYYDGATPHLAAEHVFAHLHLPRSELGRVEWAYYPAGHMMYVHEPSRRRQSADLIAFVESASR